MFEPQLALYQVTQACHVCRWSSWPTNPPSACRNEQDTPLVEPRNGTWWIENLLKTHKNQFPLWIEVKEFVLFPMNDEYIHMWSQQYLICINGKRVQLYTWLWNYIVFLEHMVETICKTFSVLWWKEQWFGQLSSWLRTAQCGTSLVTPLPVFVNIFSNKLGVFSLRLKFFLLLGPFSQLWHP